MAADDSNSHPFDIDDEVDIFDEIDEAAEAAADARGLADLDAGRFVENDEVVAWLKTWGKPGCKPAPRP